MTWAKDNDRGALRTEVGFFREEKTYFLWPRDGDPVDEVSVFETLWMIMREKFAGILQDPKFASRYYRALKDYVFRG